MDSKKGFAKQVTVGQMKQKKEEQFIKSELDKFREMISLKVDKAVVDVLQELGYTEAYEGMSFEEADEIHSKLKEEGRFLNISTEYEGDRMITKVSVVQTARTLEFIVGMEGLEES